MADEAFVFDGKNLKELGRDLRRAADDFRRETDWTLAQVGVELMTAAKAIAGQHSSTVAETIRMKAAPGVVIISAGNDNVPIAALWESGNKGSKADTASVQGVWFRHPLFGKNDEPWVNQRRYPFLRPAAQIERKRITKMMNETYTRTLEPHRLKPEATL